MLELLTPSKIVKPENLSRRSFLRLLGVTTTTAIVTPGLLLPGQPRYLPWEIIEPGSILTRGPAVAKVWQDRLTGDFLEMTSPEREKLACAVIRTSLLFGGYAVRPPKERLYLHDNDICSEEHNRFLWSEEHNKLLNHIYPRRTDRELCA